MKHLYQVAPSLSVPIGPPHLPLMVYAYGPNGFAREHPVARKPNVMGYPLAPGTRAVSFFHFFLCFFLFCISQLLVLTLLEELV